MRRLRLLGALLLALVALVCPVTPRVLAAGVLPTPSHVVIVVEENRGNIIGNSAHCQFDAQADDRLDVDAGLGALADNGGFTRTHLPGANAIDRGAAVCSASDQRGVARPQDGDGDGISACDAGAVEVGDLDAIFTNGFDGAASLRAPRMSSTLSAAHVGAAEQARPQGT